MVVPGPERIEGAARAFDEIGEQRTQALGAEHELLGGKLAVGGRGQGAYHMKALGDIAVAAEEDASRFRARLARNLGIDLGIDGPADANLTRQLDVNRAGTRWNNLNGFRLRKLLVSDADR